MPGKIVLLPADLTNKIAAGEVIERPASIVKELVENALDAGATDIAVELHRGGCEAIRITDNGEGMDPEDASLAFSRYATSKIYQFADIYAVRSFGFRGEALPSIASIARLEMTTKKKDSLEGTRVVVEEGEIRERSAVGCPVGTSILVSNIFDPVPVRRKFLKSEKTEQGQCLDALIRLALAHPEVRFRVTDKGKEILALPREQDAGQRLALLLGTDFREGMLTLTGQRPAIKLTGFASGPALTRTNARHIYVYANKRFIRDHLINHAIMTAYRNIIAAKRYPLVVLMLELPPQDLDVNVHPAKLEVRFRNPREIYEMILETLAMALAGLPPLLGAGDQERFAPAGTANHPQYRFRVEQALKRYTLSSQETPFAFAKGPTNPLPLCEALPLFPEEESQDRVPGVPAFSALTYLGQVGGTYLVFSAPEGMIILDQHAAHERMLFESLKRKAREAPQEPASQRLLMPEVISLPPREMAFLLESLALLQECGFDIEPFGNDTVVLKALPALLAQGDPKGMIQSFLEEFPERQGASLAEKKEKIYAFLACKGAVKATHPLSPAEVAALCGELDKTPFISSCPHGRPVFIPFSFAQLEKMFKRR